MGKLSKMFKSSKEPVISDDERTEGERTPSDTKSSHGLLLGELKKQNKNGLINTFNPNELDPPWRKTIKGLEWEN
jgi:hypothetical protein